MSETAHVMTPLRLEKIGDHLWRLLEPLVVYSARLRGILVAPAGMVTDLASTPRFVWTFLPKSGAYDYGCVMHDGAYTGDLQTQDGQVVHLIRLYADRLLDEVNEATGVSGASRWCLYHAVRVFSGSYFHGLGG